MTLPKLYPIVDTATLARRNLSPIAFTEALLNAGIRLLQYRHKSHYSRSIFAEAQTIAALCRQAGAQLIIDDRADIARVLHAGVHLGQDDLAPSDARLVIADAPLGFSTHNATQLTEAACEPADYLAIGPVFATGSKQNPDPVLGLAPLPALRGLTTRPLVAIGGITLANAERVLATGIDSLAVISDLIPDTGPLSTRLRDWRSLTA
ncbi:MAG: thiamine phosphate synthase [Bryobacterales bacterium]|nr:thiamine phosphate synthase [Bryobacterales bacterium]